MKQEPMVQSCFRVAFVVSVIAIFGQSMAAVVAVDLIPNQNVGTSFSPIDLNGDGTPDVRFVRDNGRQGFYAFPEPHSRIQAVFSGDVGYYWTFDYERGETIGATPPGGSSWRYDPALGNLMAVCADIGCLGFFWDYINTFTTKYLGLEFDLADGTHYGYVEIRGTYGFGLLESYGYETTPGVPIIAGSVPEPRRIVLVFAYLASATFFRRRTCIRRN